MHEAVLQVLQSLNVMLVMPGHVKEGQGPGASCQYHETTEAELSP